MPWSPWTTHRPRYETRISLCIRPRSPPTGPRSLRRQDYVSRVNLAFRECLDNNVTRAIELLDGCPQDLRGFEWQYAWRQCHLALWSVREDQSRQRGGVQPRRPADRFRNGSLPDVPRRDRRPGGPRGRDRPRAVRSPADPGRRHRRGLQPRRASARHGQWVDPDVLGGRHRPFDPQHQRAWKYDPSEPRVQPRRTKARRGIRAIQRAGRQPRARQAVGPGDRPGRGRADPRPGRRRVVRGL